MAAFDTLPGYSDIQIDVYRRMRPEARLRVGLELTALARGLLEAGIRRRHPEYDEPQVRLALIRLWLGPDLFRRAYAGSPEMDP